MTSCCPYCKGFGEGGTLIGPPSLGVGDHLMIWAGQKYLRCEILAYEPSRRKLINGGTFTYRLPWGEVGQRAGTSTYLEKPCPLCEGLGFLELTDLDRKLSPDSEELVQFYVSGGGYLYAVRDSGGRYWSYSNRRLTELDLLRGPDDRVYRVVGGMELVGKAYVTYDLEDLGEWDRTPQEIPECEIHGFYSEARCPECPDDKE